MKKILVAAGIIGLSLILGFSKSWAEESASADPHTLFLCHFNNGFAADYAKGSPEPLKRDNKGGAMLVPGKFGKALNVPKGAFGIAYASDKNIDCRQGTIEFWIRGDFPQPVGDDAEKFYLPFFDAGYDATGLRFFRGQYNHVSFTVNEGYSRLLNLSFRNEGKDSISDGKWHHLAVTWDEKHAAVFLDGKRRLQTEEPQYPLVANWCSGDMTVGYEIDADHWYQISANKQAYVPYSLQGDIDELRISDVVRYIANFRPPDKEFLK